MSLRIAMTLLALAGAHLSSACDDGCPNQVRACSDAYVLKDCSDRREVAVVNCPQSCLEQGALQFAGCDTTRHGNYCGCESYMGSSPCIPEARECTDDHDLIICRSGSSYGSDSNFWERIRCADVCVSRGAVHGTCAQTSNPERLYDCFCDAGSL